MARNLVCIICPMSCHIRITNDAAITGAKCNRGIIFAKQEVITPLRTLTTTMAYKTQSSVKRVPVKSITAIPLSHRKKIMDQVRRHVLAIKPPFGAIMPITYTYGPKSNKIEFKVTGE